MDPKPHEAGKHEHGHAQRNPGVDCGREPEPKATGGEPGSVVQLIPDPPPRGGDGDE
jgi:hypothetical protein